MRRTFGPRALFALAASMMLALSPAAIAADNLAGVQADGAKTPFFTRAINLGGNVYLLAHTLFDATGAPFLTAGNPGSVIPIASSAAGSSSPSTVGTSSVQVLSAGARKALAIQNVSSSASVACAFGSTSPALNAAGSWMLGPGQLVNFAGLGFVPADSVSCVSSAAGTPITVLSN